MIAILDPGTSKSAESETDPCQRSESWTAPITPKSAWHDRSGHQRGPLRRTCKRTPSIPHGGGRRRRGRSSQRHLAPFVLTIGESVERAEPMTPVARPQGNASIINPVDAIWDAGWDEPVLTGQRRHPSRPALLKAQTRITKGKTWQRLMDYGTHALNIASHFGHT